MEILTLGEKIRRRRKSLRLTLKDVAGDIVTPAQLSYVESNKCKPSNSLLNYICAKIGMDIEYVLESEETQAEKYCEYYMKEYEFYNKRSEFQEAQDKLLIVEKMAEEYNIDKFIGTVNFNRGLYLFFKKDFDSARYNLLTAMQIFMKYRNNDNLAKCYFYLGQICFNKKYFDDAVNFLDSASELTSRYNSGDNIFLHEILFCKAKSYYKQGKLKGCKLCINDAAALADGLEDRIKATEFFKEASLMINDICELAVSNGYINKAIGIYEDIKQYKKVLTLKTVRVLIHLKVNEYKKAAVYLDDIFGIIPQEFEEEAIFNLIIAAQCLLANGYKEYIQDIVKKIESCVANIEYNIMFLYLNSELYQEDDEIKSLEYLKKCMGHLEYLKTKRISALININLGEIHKKNKQYVDAFEFLSMGTKLLSEVY